MIVDGSLERRGRGKHSGVGPAPGHGMEISVVCFFSVDLSDRFLHECGVKVSYLIDFVLNVSDS